MAEEPFGSHQSPARPPKCAASFGSIVLVSAMLRSCRLPESPCTQRRDTKRAAVMARIVMKFGGTSMAGIERIRHVAQLVKSEAEAGHEVAVVVSAMAGETDRLRALLRRGRAPAAPRARAH